MELQAVDAGRVEPVFFIDAGRRRRARRASVLLTLLVASQHEGRKRKKNKRTTKQRFRATSASHSFIVIPPPSELSERVSPALCRASSCGWTTAPRAADCFPPCELRIRPPMCPEFECPGLLMCGAGSVLGAAVNFQTCSYQP